MSASQSVPLRVALLSGHVISKLYYTLIHCCYSSRKISFSQIHCIFRTKRLAGTNPEHATRCVV